MELLRQDLAVYVEHLKIGARVALAQAGILIFQSTFVVVALFRLSGSKNPIVHHAATLLYKVSRILSGIQIPRGTHIGGGLLLPHFGNIVISRHARIGTSCTILHNVTLADDERGAPQIGDRVYIGAGAILLGTIHVGNDAVIGAESVVTNDVPAGSFVAGNPAKPIAQNASQSTAERRAA
jgi:serine O-acetyltransferase